MKNGELFADFRWLLSVAYVCTMFRACRVSSTPFRAAQPVQPCHAMMLNATPNATTAALHHVVRYTLDLHGDVQRCQLRDLAQEQAALEMLLSAIPDNDAVDSNAPGRGARYALICWIDELFTCRSRWADAWNEHKLESRLYGANDRAWEFWRQAELAAAEPTDQTLGVYYLCVALGFRGDLREEPAKLREWFEKTRARLTRLPQRPSPADFRAPAGAPPQRGASRFRRMLVVAAVTALCLAPLAAFAIVQRLAS